MEDQLPRSSRIVDGSQINSQSSWVSLQRTNTQSERIDADVTNSSKHQEQLLSHPKRCCGCCPALSKSSADLVLGSWYFIYGSVLSALIPLIPLISLFLGWWEDKSSYLPLDIHVSVYILLVVVGIFFTVGSYAFLRAVHPDLKEAPLFNKNRSKENLAFIQRHCMTDELFGMWCFFLAVVTAIPIMSFYVYYTQDTGEYYFRGALLIVIFFTFVSGVAVYVTYPKKSTGPHKQMLAPCLQNICFRSLQPHLQNDMLILSWCMTIGCFLSTICSVGLLYDAVEKNNGREVYDYGSGLVDMVIFDVGCVYFTAGWYPDGHELEPLSPSSSSRRSTAETELEMGTATGLAVYGEVGTSQMSPQRVPPSTRPVSGTRSV